MSVYLQRYRVFYVVYVPGMEHIHMDEVHAMAGYDDDSSAVEELREKLKLAAEKEYRVCNVRVAFTAPFRPCGREAKNKEGKPDFNCCGC